MCPDLEKLHSDVALLAGMQRYFLAACAMTGYLKDAWAQYWREYVLGGEFMRSEWKSFTSRSILSTRSFSPARLPGSCRRAATFRHFQKRDCGACKNRVFGHLVHFPRSPQGFTKGQSAKQRRSYCVLKLQDDATPTGVLTTIEERT